MAIEVMTRKWGNSIGIILPKDLVEKQNLKENEMIVVNVVKKVDFSDVFGMIKKRKMSGQKMKDLSREDWKK